MEASGQLFLSNHQYSVFFGPVGIIFFAFWALASSTRPAYTPTSNPVTIA